MYTFDRFMMFKTLFRHLMIKMMVIDDICGQLTLELLVVLGFSLIITIPLLMCVADSNELNQAMAASRAGALDGSMSDAFAIYPEDAFRDYKKDHFRLVNPSCIKIIKIDYINQGLSPSYNKTKIQLRIYASSPQVKDKTDRNCLGDRINFYARKKICESFHTENLTNSLFNPAFSNNYLFTTADVRWM